MNNNCTHSFQTFIHYSQGSKISSKAYAYSSTASNLAFQAEKLSASMDSQGYWQNTNKETKEEVPSEKTVRICSKCGLVINS